jgi:hypothetical protein
MLTVENVGMRSASTILTERTERNSGGRCWMTLRRVTLGLAASNDVTSCSPPPNSESNKGYKLSSRRLPSSSYRVPQQITPPCVTSDAETTCGLLSRLEVHSETLLRRGTYDELAIEILDYGSGEFMPTDRPHRLRAYSPTNGQLATHEREEGGSR